MNLVRPTGIDRLQKVFSGAADVTRAPRGADATAVKRGSVVRRFAPFLAAMSFLILAPCFWQPRIEAGDLASHIYNAWLAQLIQQGKAPGLWIARQWTNVLFDYALVFLSVRFGVVAAQRIAVSLSVLIFFWGAFSAMWVLSRRRPWYVLPCLAVLTYGVMFHLGSLNYYTALGLSFFALALLWRPTVRRTAAALPLLAVAWLAQPLPALWVLCAAVYAWIARRIAPRFRVVQFLTALVLLFGLRELVMHSFVTLWSPRQILYVTGADQAVVFGRPYRLVFLGLLGIWGGAIVRKMRTSGYHGIARNIVFQLYALCALGAFLLPSNVLVTWPNIYFGDIPQRFSLIAGTLACAVSNTARLTRWHAACFLLVATFFFVRLYLDASAMNRIEAKVENIVSQLPPGQRVIGRLYYPLNGGLDISMILDRACIGKCFSYANYEPSTQQFRVRAAAGNGIVAWNQTEPVPVQYSASHPNQPLFQIYRCGHDLTDLCVRTL